MHSTRRKDLTFGVTAWPGKPECDIAHHHPQEVRLHRSAIIPLEDNDDCFYYFKGSILVPLIEGLCSSEFELSVLRSHLLLCFSGRKNKLRKESS